METENKTEKKPAADAAKKQEEMAAASTDSGSGDKPDPAAESGGEEEAEHQPDGSGEDGASEAKEDASADEDAGDTGEESGDAQEDPEKTDGAKTSDAVNGGADAPAAEPDAGKDPNERARALDEREKTLLARELRATAIEELAKEQLPSALADCFRYDSEAAFKQSKESVVKAFQGALKEAVDARLRGKPPKTAESAKGSKASGHNFSDIINKNKARR